MPPSQQCIVHQTFIDNNIEAVARHQHECQVHLNEGQVNTRYCTRGGSVTPAYLTVIIWVSLIVLV